MRRDMDLLREILLDLEKKDHSQWVTFHHENYTDEEVNYHVKLAYQAGLIEAKDISTFDGTKWMARDLTWQGHEFLDAAKNDKVWNKVKKKVAEQGGNIPFDVLKELLKQAAKTYFMGQ